MKKTTTFFLLRTLLIALCSFLPVQQMKAVTFEKPVLQQGPSSLDENEAITAKDYGDFLNAAATPFASPLKLKVEAINSNDLYDERMQGGSIMRTGLPGSYCYNLIGTASTDSFHSCIAGLSWNDAQQYCEWRNHSASTSTFNLNSCGYDAAHVDPELKSNLLTFRLVSTEVRAYQAGGPEIIEAVGIDEIFENILVGVFLLAGLEGSRGPEATPTTFRREEQQTIQQALERLTQREELQTDSLFIPADAMWNQRESTWQNHQETHRQFQESQNKLILAQKQVEEASEADANRDKSHLGTFKQRLEQLAATLHYVPEPHTQIVATAADTAAKAVDWINTIWSKIDLVQARRAYRQAEESHTTAQKAADHATIEATQFEHEATQHEAAALRQEHDKTKKLAEALRPQGGWRPHEWEAWSQQLVTQEEDLSTFTQQSKENLTWIIEQTAAAWQARLRQAQGELRHLTQESKKRMASFQRACDQAERLLEQRLEVVDQAAKRIQEAERQQVEFKNQIEVFLQHALQGEEWNQQIIDQRRQEFCDNFNSLIRTTSAIQEQQQTLDKALQQKRNQHQQAAQASQQLETERRKQQRLLSRSQKRFQADQEALRTIWPEYDLTYRPYLEWSLPEFSSPAAAEENLERNEASHTDIISPPELQEEREAVGRRYLYQARAAIVGALNPKTIFSALLKETESQQSSAKISSSLVENTSEMLTPYDELQEWSVAQVDHPAVAERQRWAARRQLDLAHQKTKNLARALQQEIAATEQNETGTLLSWTSSKGTAKKKTPTRLSDVTISTAIAKENNVAQGQSIPEQFQRAYEIENQYRERWYHLMSQAELKRSGQALGNEEETTEAWKQADRTALSEQYHRDQLFREKQDAEALDKSWKENNLRWQARAEADQAAKRCTSLQQQQQKLSIKNGLSELQRRKQGAELEEKLKQAAITATQTEGAWRGLAEKSQRLCRINQATEWDEGDLFRSSTVASSISASLEKSLLPNKATIDQKRETAFAQLRAADQAVVSRWEQWQTPSDAEAAAKKQAEEQEEVYDLDLPLKLEVAEQEAFKTSPTLEVGVKKYQRASIAEALRAARKNIPNAAIAWQERLRKAQRQLAVWEQEAIASEISQQTRADRRDRLPQLRGVIASDEKAKKIFEKEVHRLDRIEELWKSISTAQKEATLQKAKEAAMAYDQGNKIFWEQLHQEEREEYDDYIHEKNRQYNETLATEKKDLEEIKKRLEKEERKGKTFLARFVGTITGTQQTALNLLKLAQEHYEERCQEFMSRQEALRLAALTPQEREKETQGQIRHQLIGQDRKKAEEAGNKAKDVKKAENKAEKQGDKDAVWLHGKVANAFLHQVSVYEKAAEAEAERYHEVAEAYRKSGKVSEEQAMALMRGDEKAAELHEKVAELFFDQAQAYEKAAYAEAKERHELAESCRMQGKADEEQAAALMGGDEEAAELHRKTREIFARHRLSCLGAVIEEATGNHEAVEIYRKEGKVLKEQAAALMRGDENAAQLHEKAIGVLHRQAQAYEKAAEAEAEGNHEVAESYRKSGKALEEETMALMRGDEDAAQWHSRGSAAFLMQAWAYENAAKEEAKGSHEVAELYRKKGKALEELAAALMRGDEQAADIFSSQALAYENAIGAEAKGNHEVLEIYRNEGKVLKEQASALMRGDEKAAELHKKIAGLFLIQAQAYENAAKEKANGNHEVAEICRKFGKVREEQVATLMRGDEKAAELHEKVVQLYEKAAEVWCSNDQDTARRLIEEADAALRER